MSPTTGYPGQRTRCERAAVLIDAAAYFSTLCEAFERAERSIYILGWDIRSDLCLKPQASDPSHFKLSKVLNRATERNRRLEVHILTWDFAPIYLAEREFLPVVQFAFKTGRRVHFRLASDHGVGVSHHQKIVVVDDRLAFLGGIDLAMARWDEAPHRAEHPLRLLPNGQPYGPFHDIQLCLDGDAARALGMLFRERWRRATSSQLAVANNLSTDHDPWPASLAPQFTDVPLFLMRTQAPFRVEPRLAEVEEGYLQVIAQAQRYLYIENQYVTSFSVRDALLASLSRPSGPEVIIITPREQSGRLEQVTMGELRAHVVSSLRAADRHGRLRVLSPVVGPQPVGVNVHAKLLIADDDYLRVGSANLSNRSMRLDTECDVALIADRDEARQAIGSVRNQLLGEHLGVSAARVAEALGEHRSLIATVAALVGGEERTLLELDLERDEALLRLPSKGRLVDPVRPLDEALVRVALPEEAVELGSRRLHHSLILAALIAAVGVAWLWTPLRDWTDPDRLIAAADELRTAPLGWLVATGVFVCASLLMVPVLALIVAASVVFGTWTSFFIIAVGSLASAICAYAVGRMLWRDAVRRMAGRRLNAVSRKLARKGTFAVAAARVLPLAPFTVVNLVAGASQVRFWDFVIGTSIGMAPGVFALCLASDQVAATARNPSPATVAVTAGVVLGALGLVTWVRKLAERMGVSAKGEGGDG